MITKRRFAVMLAIVGWLWVGSIYPKVLWGVLGAFGLLLVSDLILLAWDARR